MHKKFSTFPARYTLGARSATVSEVITPATIPGTNSQNNSIIHLPKNRPRSWSCRLALASDSSRRKEYHGSCPRPFSLAQ